MELELPVDVVRYLDEAVATGMFANHAEAISVAVRSLRVLESHRAELEAVLAQLESSEFDDLDDDHLLRLVDEIESP